MKPLSLLVIALCTCATFCTQEDTRSPSVWGRNVEPRLTTTQRWEPCDAKTIGSGKVVETTRCGTGEHIPSYGACDQISPTSTHKHVLNVLAFEPRCTDEAIAALERFARVDPKAMSDVAAAYYIRAQRLDAPSDLLRAMDATDQAVAADRALPAARFNRALILEALGLRDHAIAAWDEFIRVAEPGWDVEARQHRSRLVQTVDDSTRWRSHRDVLPAALASRDRDRVARLIAPFPSAAQRYFEEELLPQWADSPTADQLERVSVFAIALSARLGGDPFATDVVNAIARASPDQLTLLRKGHATFRTARRDEQLMQSGQASDAYRRAADWFRQAGSPFRLRAELGYAASISFQADGRPRALALLMSIGDEAATQRYRSLASRIEWMRATAMDQNSYFEAQAAYDRTIASYTRLRDFDGLVAAYSRRAGVLRILGHADFAWRDTFYASRHAHRLVDVKDRHALLLEAAAAALALGHARTSLLFHNAGIAMLESEFGKTLPEDVHYLKRTTQQLGIAFAHRAPVELQLGRVDRALADWRESARRIRDVNNPDPDTKRIQKSRADEVLGQALSNADPEFAAAAFSRALAGIPSSASTWRVTLLTQRAEAYLRAGRGDDAETDLREAVAILAREEQSILAKRQIGEGEGLWSPYFKRFQNTHRLLIRRLIEKGDEALAFAYAEHARAVEPLDLLLKLGYAPEHLAAPRPLNEEAARVSLARIQASLPYGTFLIEYYVLEDRTYVWILSASRFERRTLMRVGRAETNRWSGDLQKAVRRLDANAIDALLVAAYEQLAAIPLSVIAEMPDGVRPERLVFIPDGAIHGLPLVALRNAKTGQYLIERGPIEIAGSAALYALSIGRDRAMRPAQNPSVLAIGNPSFNSSMLFGRGMKRLPHAEDEATEIHRFYSPDADILLAEQATAPAFFLRAADHEIVHIAAHAIVNEQAPSRSMLLFAPSPGHAGAIDAEELLRGLKLHRTRLVILSTCSSAGGLSVGPEGVAPLVRPLLAAGVPAVIGSLWEVDDATTEELMVSFHRHYSTGSDAAVAMRKAQLGLLDKTSKDTGLRSVLAWAPFQVIGHASSPFAPRAPSNGGTQIGIHSSNSLQRTDGLRPQ
jgi:CHAT domain-containing protein/tetratricopeptide (TPR) repeat protein